MARESKESVRDSILSAAQARFWHYGIKKTTIDEIAADADVGKGTVYLHFDSKEEIAVAIIAKYKQAVIVEQKRVAGDCSAPLLDRIKRVLSLPILTAYEHCAKSPAVFELVSAIRPELAERLKGLVEQEVAIITTLIEEGNTTGEMHVADPPEAARMLKRMTQVYMPAISTTELGEKPDELVSQVVDLVYRGLK